GPRIQDPTPGLSPRLNPARKLTQDTVPPTLTSPDAGSVENRVRWFRDGLPGTTVARLLDHRRPASPRPRCRGLDKLDHRRSAGMLLRAHRRGVVSRSGAP